MNLNFIFQRLNIKTAFDSVVSHFFICSIPKSAETGNVTKRTVGERRTLSHSEKKSKK
jgi:hypothetical protein